MINGIRGRVEGGVVKLQYPLAEGAEVTVMQIGHEVIDNVEQEVVFDPTGDDLNDEDRTALHACLRRGVEWFEAGAAGAISYDEMLAGLDDEVLDREP